MDRQPDLDLFVVAAASVLPSIPAADSKKYATWAATVAEEDFDAESTLRYLKSEKKDIAPELVRCYAIPNRPPISLRRIGTLAKWIKPLPEEFRSQASFRSIRQSEEFSGIITFSTPAISPAGDQAFLEVWAEDGQYSHMGRWWWVLLNRSESQWQSVWTCRYAIS